MNQTLEKTPDRAPYLTVVATSRNDDHGGDPLIRTQIFINCLAAQCAKFRLPTELIIVDWNPPTDRPTLSEVLIDAESDGYLTSRVIIVDNELHRQFKYSDRLHLFQMIGKNVGIQRAQGQFILATNIDIIFSDELISFIARQELSKTAHYRVDRYDIRSSGLGIGSTLDEALEYAWSNVIHTNRRLTMLRQLETMYSAAGDSRTVAPIAAQSQNFGDYALTESHQSWALSVIPRADFTSLHTNACGDFALMSREGWSAIEGYPEFETYSFNIDSMGLANSHYGGFHEISLLPPCVCFHIEHSLGSGYSEAGQGRLFGRMKTLNIASPTWPVLMPLIDSMREAQHPIAFNYKSWGLRDHELPESPLGKTCNISKNDHSKLSSAIDTRRVGAIKPAYDYDHLVLCHNNTSRPTHGFSTSITSSSPVSIYLPDEFGNYSMENKIVSQPLSPNTSPVVFSLNSFPAEHSLFISPCDRPALIDIRSIRAIDHKGNILVEIDRNSLPSILPQGDARLIGDGKSKSLTFVSIGEEPILVLPPLGKTVAFPLLIILDISVYPDRHLAST